MIKCCDHLDVAAAGKGQDEVSGPELRMPSSIPEGGAEIGANPLHDVSEFSGGTGVGHVIKPHGGILPTPVARCRTGPR